MLKTRCADVLQEHGVKDDELQSILNYLLTMHEVGMQAQTPHRWATRWRHNTTVLPFVLLWVDEGDWLKKNIFFSPIQQIELDESVM